jgi:hypothetical protein
VDLRPYGIESDFPQLSRLDAEIADLRKREAEAGEAVNAARAAIAAATAKDAEAASRAVRSGKRMPEAKHEQKATAQLEDATRTLEAFASAVAEAAAERGQFIASHRAEIRAGILAALRQKALELREHALSSLELFGTIEDARHPLRTLAPPPEPEPELPEGWRGNRLSQSYIGFGPDTIAPGGGIQRGDIERVLAHLAGLAVQFEGDTEEGAA